MKSIFVVGARGIPDVEGGVEKAVEQIFPSFVKSGWHVTVGGLKPYIKDSRFAGIQLWTAPNSTILSTDKVVYYVLAIYHAYRTRPDVIYLAGLGAAIFLFAYKFLGCKIVVRYGSADYLVEKWGLLGRLGFLLAEFQLRYSDAVAAVSPALVSRLKQRGISKNVHLVPNALDDPETSDIGPEITDSPIVLAVGRLTPQKNLPRLLAGFSTFRRSHEAAKLILVGTRDNHSIVARQLSPVPNGVELKGHVPRSQLGPIYRGAKIFINASLHEGHSNAILEAISHGCPTLLSDIPENRSFGLSLKHYFDPKSADSIAHALTRAYSKPEQYRVSPAGFARWSEIASQTEAICDELWRSAKRNQTSQIHHESA